MKIKELYDTHNDKRKKRAIGEFAYLSRLLYDPNEMISAEWDRENVKIWDTVEKESQG